MKIKSILRFMKFWVMSIMSLFLFYISGEFIKNKKRLLKLKGIYKGKRIFVVCNGPSLRVEDLTKLHETGTICVGMNQIAHVYSDTPWRVNFLVCTDGVCFHKKNRKLVRECKADVKIFNKKRYIESLSYKGDKIYVTCCGNRSLLDKPRFSEKLEKIVYCIGTTAYESIEWARYLGAEEIYIIGCDMSYAVNANRDGSVYYNNSGNNHFYAQNKDIISNIKPVQTWEQKLAHKAADDYSREHGFRIYNATRGGCLEEYERVKFDDIFK